jgi:ferredoxin-NADP reductase
MEKHIVRVLETSMITHNVKRFVLERPPGLHFESGQATELSINKPGLVDELRPFTFTSINTQDHLEFMIKIYSHRDGVTKALGLVEAGDQLIVHEVFGTITYHGSGLFIAGGAGITPFISIFRDLKSKGALAGNKLIFVNRTPADVILKGELEESLGDNFISVVETPEDPGVPACFISEEIIKSYLDSDSEFCYVCGPDSFTKVVVDFLIDLGVNPAHIIIEQ